MKIEKEKNFKLKKYCNKVGCHCLIDYHEKYCEKHKNRETEVKKERHKYYDTHKRDIDLKRFYNSAAWKKVREQALIRDHYIDIYLYHKKGIIVAADTVHHIIEVKEDAKKRLELDNLISVSEETHNKISQLYKEPLKKEELQKEFINLVKNRGFWNEF